jgi:hypothetical protein|tara:strand:- start:5470 stop:5898 length:429 start_codon:yes stop_codon:yes gene_type:complete
MKYSFTCYGHENITSKHKTTLEFTKDKDLRLDGDCIVGVRADFNLEKIKRFIKKLNNNKTTIIIKTMDNKTNKIKNNKIIEKINAEINPGFNSGKEMVIRKTDFVSERTFAIKSDKAAFELNNDLIVFLKKKMSKVRVIVEN